MANQAVISQVQIVLNTPSDWEDWIEVIQTRAQAAGIWGYVDPSIKKDNLPNLIEPELPTASTVNSAKPTFASLSEDEKEELKLLCFKYKHDLAKYEQQEIALINL